MTMPNFMSKAFSYQNLHGGGRRGGGERGEAGTVSHWGMIRQKYPRADRVNRYKTLGERRGFNTLFPKMEELSWYGMVGVNILRRKPVMEVQS